MGLKLTKGEIKDKKVMRALFLLCWFAYFTCYLGRLNYAACLADISASEGWSKTQAGLVATAFFTCYGIGQFINGMIGDKISPKIMVQCGLLCSGLANFMFPVMGNPAAAAVLWGINGFVQSMIWSPIIRLLSEWLPEEKRQNACVNMNGTVPVGTLGAYGMSALLVYISGWKAVFFTSGTILIVVSVVWAIMVGRTEKKVEPVSETVTVVTDVPEIKEYSMGKLIMMSAVPFICFALILQGMLKDGVTTWIPTFLEEQFNLPTAAAILSTTIVPIINLGGVYLASWMNKRFFKNEMLGAAVFFIVGTVTLTLLNFLPGNSAVVSLTLLALTTTFMMSINTILASMMPSYYVRFGKTSTFCGVLNAAVYIGSAISSYANGAIVENYGWNTIMHIWLVYAVIGIVVCALGIKKWRNFVKFAKAE